ncbi:MAG: FAD-binding protein [Myxococcaceae bacterium]|nr:FAD-binding protein [Myxococcaceae bacterium]
MSALEQALGAMGRREGDRLVAMPRSERELAQLFAILVGQRGLLGRDVHLDRARLDRLGAVDDRSMTIDAAAGVPVRDVEARANAHRLTLGPLAPSAWELSVGALIEHPGHAFRAVVPGRLEPLAARIVAVLAQGHVITSAPGPRHASGPDLASLVIGAGGAVGLVTQATLRLEPLPAVEERRTSSFSTHAQAIEALREALSAGLVPARVVLRARAGRIIVETTSRGPASHVDRQLAVLTRVVERTQGRVEGAGREAEVDGTEHEATWDDVASALAIGASVELFRISLSTVLARGVRAPDAPRSATRLSTLLDPSSILSGER